MVGMKNRINDQIERHLPREMFTRWDAQLPHPGTKSISLGQQLTLRLPALDLEARHSSFGSCRNRPISPSQNPPLAGNYGRTLPDTNLA